MSTETNYPHPVNKLLTLGNPCQKRNEWPDYLAIGLTQEHVPHLIQLAADDDLDHHEIDGEQAWPAIHARRALGQLKAQAAVKPLLNFLQHINHSDDWLDEELPLIFGLIGPAAIPDLATHLADPANPLYVRLITAGGLEQIGQNYPQARQKCVSTLTGQLEKLALNDFTLNAAIIDSLVQLKAAEAAPVIERAFAAEAVDEAMIGDWETTQLRLGLRPKRKIVRPKFDLEEELPQFKRARNSDPSDEFYPTKKARRWDKAWTEAKRKHKQLDKTRKQSRKKRER